MQDHDLLEILQDELCKAFGKKRCFIELTKNNFDMKLVWHIYWVKLFLGKKWLTLNPDFALGELHFLLKKMKSKLKPNFKIDETKIKLALDFMKHYADVNVKEYNNPPELQEIFDELNATYFNNQVSKTRLKWSNGIKTLGSYNYFTNTISISKLLKDSKEALSYVIYHEMLHKYLKFKYKTRITFHSKEFRALEKQFPNAEKIEKYLHKLVNHAMRERKRLRK